MFNEELAEFLVHQIKLEKPKIKKEIKPSKIPEREILKNLIRNNSFLSIGLQFGVSDNAVRKWCKKYNLPYKKNEIKNISDSDWLKV